MKIKGVIDPGHGGKSNWNVGYSGKYYEHIGMLELSKLIKQKLEATGMFDIKLTRNTDIFLELWERAQIAVDFKAQFFISEHTNAGSVSARGSEVFYSVDIPGDKVFAARLSADIAKTFNVPNRGAKTKTGSDKTWDGVNKVEDYFGVIDYAQDHGVSHVWLVENLFHSNPDDEQILLTQIDLIADITAKNICIEFGVQYPSKEVKKKVKNLVVYGKKEDKPAAEQLAYKLKCPVMDADIPYDYSNIENVYCVGAPGKLPFTSYAKEIITGTDQADTVRKVLEFKEA